MSRELKIHAVCDAPGCSKEFIVEPEEKPVTIVIDGETIELDLCFKSKTEFRQMWLGQARPATVTRLKSVKDIKAGKAPRPPKRRKGRRLAKPDSYPCPQPGCPKAFSHVSSVRSHLHGPHGLQHDEIAKIIYEKFGGRTPMPRENCPECGDSYSVNMMPKHRKNAHGIGE